MEADVENEVGESKEKEKKYSEVESIQLRFGLVPPKLYSSLVYAKTSVHEGARSTGNIGSRLSVVC